MHGIRALALACLILAVVAKKKDVQDYTEADLERLFEEWEQNEDELPEDERPDHERPRPNIPIDDLKQQAKNPDDLLRLSKKGQSVMMFISVVEGGKKGSRSFTDRLSQLWQSNLFNNHIDVQSYVVDDDRILFLFKDGSRAWEGRDYILKQPECAEITLEGNTIPGAGSKKHTEL
ncbi:hypothetical protein M3Y99_01109100 [Aphelenchoides fujianensis]|nr:hypothetical protein M3Y99_01109100 [Aphelenchoides fujianensis]